MLRTGLARLLDGELDARLKGLRLGLIANPTTVDTRMRHAADLLHERYDVGALFGPEHGIRGDAQYMVAVDDAPDRVTGLPVYSLYGHDEASLSPTQASLDEVDVLVFDIQDVGARYYTYVWTMVLAMRACAAAGRAFMVLDRPNPIDGVFIEGGRVHPGFESFVGLRSLPNRHGLTAGEIALWAKADEALDLELEVVQMQGWSRSMRYPETGLPWVQPSPNMPTVDTALVYPGMCLLEGTEVSEGRGTTRPFELFGAPYIDSRVLVQCLDTLALPGVHFRAASFTPTFDKFTGQLCHGAQIHVSDPQSFRSYDTAVAIVWAVRTLYPEEFEWRSAAYEFVEDIPAFDLLAGSASLRQGIDAGVSPAELFDSYRSEEEELRESMRGLHIYE